MRFGVGEPPEQSGAIPSAPEWAAIDNPVDVSNPLVVWRYATIGALFGGTLIAAWNLYAADAWGGSFREAFSPHRPLLFLLAVVVAHEAIHVLAHPSFGLSHRTVVGCLVRPFVPYAIYVGPLSRERVLMIQLAPVLLLSVAPATLSFVVPGFGNGDIMMAASMNLALSTYDLRNSFELLRRVPLGATLVSYGGKAWWRRAC